MADNIKGITIEIGGDVSPLNKALGEVNKESRSIQNELKSVERLLKLDPSNTELVAQKQKLLGEAVEKAKEKLDFLRKAQEQVEQQFKNGDMGEAEYRAFQRQVISAEQAVKSAEDAQKKYGDECEQAGKDAKEAGESSEKAGKKAKQSGDDAKEGGGGWQKFGELAKTAGKVAVAGVAAVGAGAAATGKKIWDMAQDTAAATDAIDKQSQAIGLSREAYQEYDYILSQSGMDISAMTGVTKKLTQQMDAVTEGNKLATANFEKLGVSIYDSNGKLKSQEQMLAESISALQGMEDGTEKARLATELFGKQGQTLMPLLNGEASSMEELRQKAHDLGMVLDDEAVTAGVNFTDSLDTLKRTFSGVKNSIMANMLPGLTQLTSGFTNLIAGQKGAGDAIKEGVNTMLQSFKEAVPQLTVVLQTIIETIIMIAPEIITTLVTVLLGCLPTLIDTAFQIMQSLLNSITGNVQMVVDVIMQLLTACVTFIITNLPLFIDAGLQIIVALINGIASALPQIIQAIVDMIPKLIQAITDNLPLIIEAGITLLLSLTQGLIDAIPQLLDALPTIISALLDGILSAIPQLIDAGIQLLTALVAALPEIIQKIVEVLPQIINAIIDAILNNIPLIIQAGIDLLVALIQALPQIITTIVAALPKIITSIVDALIGNIDKIIMAGVQLLVALVENTPKIIVEVVKAIPKIIKGLIDAIIGFVPKIAECGLNLIKGLWNGIKDAGAWLWDKISGFFGGIVDKIKGFFGIHSPSTLFRDMIGRNLVKGISVGVDVETPNLQDELQDNLSSVTAGLQTTIDTETAKLDVPSAPAGGVSLGGISFNIEKFYNSTDKDMRQLVEEAMEVAEEYIRRRGGVFA